MPEVLIPQAAGAATPLQLVSEAGFAALPEGPLKTLAAAHDFKGQAGRLVVQPGPDGSPSRVLVGAGAEPFDPLLARGLPSRLPPGDYLVEGLPDGARADLFAVAWALGAYVFDRYKARPQRGRARLVRPAGVDLEAAHRLVAASLLAREMVDTPAADMGPLQIETIAREIAEEAGAAVTVTAGDARLEAGYPAIHAVGRAAAPHRAPRLIEIGRASCRERV